MKIHREEIFGPAVVVMKFVDEEDVIEQANDTIYGLASAIHSKNITKALRVVNYALSSYTSIESVFINLSQKLQSSWNKDSSLLLAYM
ncbi:hypothetical protein MJO29_003409 [Puccinia striiformis f. sp. tritici]|nr:hypothetical protein MJO29_003409 [Puccinia striiformis f. sp. tritici]